MVWQEERKITPFDESGPCQTLSHTWIQGQTQQCLHGLCLEDTNPTLGGVPGTLHSWSNEGA